MAIVAMILLYPQFANSHHGNSEFGASGGVLRHAGTHFVEVVGKDSEILVFLLRLPQRTPDAQNAQVKASIQQGDQSTQLKCRVESDHFRCELPSGKKPNEGMLDAQCRWSGGASSDFSNSANWDFCYGAPPSNSTWITVPSNSTVTPVVSGNVNIKGISSSGGGGTLNVAPGAKLTIEDGSNSISSSVTLQGSSPTCTTCEILFPNGGTIRNNSTVTLGRGIRILLKDHTTLNVGTNSSPGHLTADVGASNPSGWPVITSIPSGDPGNYGITVEGTASTKSRLRLNGIKFEVLHDWTYGINMLNYFEITQLDNVNMTFDTYGASTYMGISFANCPNAIFGDTNWSNITLQLAPGASLTNMNASCNPGSTINFTGSGTGYGSGYENDPSGMIDWN